MKAFALSLLLFFNDGEQFISTYSEQDVIWLAKNVYYEARNQGLAGRLAVAHVTINRVYDARFPNTIHEVVTQGPTRPSWRTGEPFPIRHKCQFSWFCDGLSDNPYDEQTYNEILNFVMTFLDNYDIMIDITEGATHYHADYVSPDWASSKTRTTEIEDHIFYRWELPSYHIAD